MDLRGQDDILLAFRNDPRMMEILEAAQTLNLKDWWICAGFVRSKIWDIIHNFREPTRIDDVDVVYFDKTNTDKANEKGYEQKLKQILPSVPWSVKNEARMHLINGISPYTSTQDAISKFPETATALGLTFANDGSLHLTAPHGVEDVLNVIVRPTPYFLESSDRMRIYSRRLKQKNWKATWNQVTYLVE
ncbi:nucleotidyltransferase family protein [Ornithinibacillus xuwenensis]|uniref:Nucleotidyltransferase family protein n=1 Tax=Ornithinibacillus xuwenensis TaxID=3144668 RepID=A0ABU9XJX7_9BACI